MMVHESTFLVVLVLVAFLPSVIYLVSARNWERVGKEPYRRLLVVFLYGAVVAIIISVLLELAILGNLERFERLYQLGDESFVGAVVVAPFVEEAAKALGLLLVIAYFQRQEDGMVYGIAAGLGFAATENLLYEISALYAAGIAAYLMTAILRTISSTLLHATATGVTGLGVGKAVMKGDPLLYAFPYYMIAVVMHAAFNLMAGLSRTHPETFGDAATTGLVSLFIGIGFAIFAWRALREHITTS
jgi:RsiW-degrading membrane proteinase PrsW (M82 family)